jgi:hypothetical protein
MVDIAKSALMSQTLRMMKTEGNEFKKDEFKPDTEKGMLSRLKEWIGSVVFRTDNSRSLVKSAVIEHLGGKENFQRIVSHGGFGFKLAMKFGNSMTANNLQTLKNLCSNNNRLEAIGDSSEGIRKNELINGIKIQGFSEIVETDDFDLMQLVWNKLQNNRLDAIEKDMNFAPQPSESPKS